MLEAYLLFYQFSVKAFIKLNLLLQREDPLISCVHGHIQRFLKKLTLKFLNLDIINENNNPAQIDFEVFNNQKSSNVKKGVLCGLILRFLYSVHLIRKKIRLLFIGFRQSNDNDFCKNQSHLHLFALSYSLCESLEL